MMVKSGRQKGRLVLVIAGAVGGGFVLAASIVAALHFTSGGMGAGQDAHAYWLALRSMPYQQDPGAYGAYLYSPAFTQLFSPLLSLAFPQFMALWTFLLLLALLVLTGPLLFVLVLPFAFFELWGGNITLFLALALVVGFRYPAAWSFVLLTKVTPGLGLLWFAVRREWHALLVASLATVAIAAVSWLVAPASWSAWLAMLLGDAGMGPASGSIPIPLMARLPIAVLVIVVAALRDRRWLLPFGVLLAMPVLWFGSLTLLIASIALERERLESRVEALGPRIRTGIPQLVRLVRREPAWTAQPEH
jgi:Glycosyltransferase family 87